MNFASAVTQANGESIVAFNLTIRALAVEVAAGQKKLESNTRY